MCGDVELYSRGHLPHFIRSQAGKRSFTLSILNLYDVIDNLRSSGCDLRIGSSFVHWT